MYLHIGTRSGQPKQFKILLALYYYIGSLVWLDGVRRDGYQFIWWWLIHWSGIRSAMCPRCNGNFSTELLFNNFWNFYQVTSYQMHGWFGSSTEKRGEEWFLFIIIYQYGDEMVFNKMVSCPPSSTFLPLFQFYTAAYWLFLFPLLLFKYSHVEWKVSKKGSIETS